MRSLVCIALFFSTLLVACGQISTNWSQRIVSKERRPLSYWLNPCGEVINELAIDGKHFAHVRGVGQFYLQIPHTNIIVFVVDEKNYSVTYHVFNMDTGQDAAISGRNSVFGNTIGSATLRDTIEVGESGILELWHVDRDAKSTLPSLANLDSVKSVYCLDIPKKAIVAEKTLFFDKSGKLIRQVDASPPF